MQYHLENKVQQIQKKYWNVTFFIMSNINNQMGFFLESQVNVELAISF